MLTRTRAAIVVLGFCLFLGSPVAAAGQAPFPGGVNIDGGWVPCSHPIAIDRGLGCETQPGAITAPPLVPAPSSADCYPYPDPYTDPARAARCAAWLHTQIPTPAAPTFIVGATYVHPYPAIRMVVLAVSRALDGTPVVTAQFTGGTQTGEVFAFRVDQAQPWTLAQ